jgi:hypothetical protein
MKTLKKVKKKILWKNDDQIIIRFAQPYDSQYGLIVKNPYKALFVADTIGELVEKHKNAVMSF